MLYLLPPPSHTHTHTHSQAMVPLYMARILKDVVPLMDRPSPSFLAALEGNIVKIIMNYGPIVRKYYYSDNNNNNNRLSNTVHVALHDFYHFYYLLLSTIFYCYFSAADSQWCGVPGGYCQQSDTQLWTSARLLCTVHK